MRTGKKYVIEGTHKLLRMQIFYAPRWQKFANLTHAEKYGSRSEAKKAWKRSVSVHNAFHVHGARIVEV